MKVFQQRVLRWLETTFPAAPWTNLGERRRRFLEEALELLQALGMTRQEVGAITDYVFNREPGDPAQELGGVMVTLGALSGVLGLDMEEEGEREITRVEHPSMRAKVQEKQKAKDSVGVGFVTPSFKEVYDKQMQRVGEEIAKNDYDWDHDACACGHIRDEHDGAVCQVECCPCEQFEFAP